MGIGLFRKPYTIRRHGPQNNIDGYMASPHEDSIVLLNVQPKTPNQYLGDPDGERTVKHLKSWGADALTSADEYAGTPGDMLFYMGIWYECKSSAPWDHTILSHYESDFVAFPASKQPDAPEVTP